MQVLQSRHKAKGQASSTEVEEQALCSIHSNGEHKLANKTNELAALVRNMKIYRECSLIRFSEKWPTSNTPDAKVD